MTLSTHGFIKIRISECGGRGGSSALVWVSRVTEMRAEDVLILCLTQQLSDGFCLPLADDEFQTVAQCHQPSLAA